MRRLRLLRNARMLGLSVPEAGEFVRQAFASDCSTFGPELMQLIASKRADVRQRIASLHALHDELEALERHVGHADCVAQDGQVANCGYRPLIDGEGTACCGEDTSST